MNILLESRAFYPSVGGLEMMAQELGRAWQKRGHNVRVVSMTSLDGEAELEDLDVLRSPTPSDWVRQMQWADVFFQNGVSLRSITYALLSGCPIVFRHPDILRSSNGVFDLRNELKRWATLLGKNIASCKAVAEPVLGKTVTVPNTVRPIFQDQLENERENSCRSGLLFVGRLVSIKGLDVALRALHILRQRGMEKTLTVCGDGPEREKMESQVEALGLTETITFEGWTEPTDLVHHYSTAEVTVIPSRYEPFGIVALESIACGCPVVASEVDGLPEATGSCGLLVGPNDPRALADAIEKVLRPKVRHELRSAMSDHIERHRIDHIAGEYLKHIEEVV